MDYKKVLSKANENKHNASIAGPVKRYSTEVPPPKKKPPDRSVSSAVQSDAVKAFLFKRKQEEETRARVAEQRKQDLLELRSIARNGRKANAMAKRTKDNNFMTNFAKTAELAAEQAEKSNIGSVQRRFDRLPLSPQWKSSKATTSSSSDHQQHQNQTSSLSSAFQQRMQRRPANNANKSQPQSGSNLNFYDLLKVAAKKQHEPLDIPRIPKKSKEHPSVVQGRMMTTEEKRRFQEELARKNGKSLDEVHVPKRSRKRYVAGNSEGEDADDGDHHRPSVSTASSTKPQLHNRSGGRPVTTANVSVPSKQVKNSVSTNRPALQPSQPPPTKKYLHLNNDKQKITPTLNGSSHMKKTEARGGEGRDRQKTVMNDERKQSHQQQQQRRRLSQSGQSAPNRPTNRPPQPPPARAQNEKTNVKSMTNKVPSMQSSRQAPNSTSKASRPTIAKQLSGSSASRSSNPANGKFSEASSSSRMAASTSMAQRYQLPDIPPNAPYGAKMKMPQKMDSLALSRPVHAREQTLQSKARAPLPPQKQAIRNNSAVGPSRQSSIGNRGAPSKLSSASSTSRLFPPRDVAPPSRAFPPRDLAPRQFPPRDLERRSLQRPPLKRRIESDDDDEDEYDEEMDDFIDDGPLEDVNDLDYSEHIKQIFGYDRSKYRYQPDDMCMESSFLQQMKEEAISAKMGILEDLEDIQREEEDMKRRTVRSKKAK